MLRLNMPRQPDTVSTSKLPRKKEKDEVADGISLLAGTASGIGGCRPPREDFGSKQTGVTIFPNRRLQMFPNRAWMSITFPASADLCPAWTTYPSFNVRIDPRSPKIVIPFSSHWPEPPSSGLPGQALRSGYPYRSARNSVTVSPRTPSGRE